MMRKLTFVATLMFCAVGARAVAEDLNCLPENERPAASLYAHLQQQAYVAFDRRDATIETLIDPTDIRDYQARLREFFIEQLGGFPERTPLNAQTVGTISADGYRIEKVIYESRPRHHITANLYLPDGEGPFPGVVVSSGHSRTAKTADYNQRFGIIMALHGMAALCFDPIGQGERSQILDDEGHPRYAGTTTEHSLMGAGSILVGRNTATYRVWDAMRSIDYLVSRPEIDPTKIGMTGCSGGGTLTSYTMALDNRVFCAAPSCYLTTFRRLIETKGPQDAEQDIFGQIARGLDQTDYVLLRAPKPTMISATTGDFFDIRGTWETYRQSKRVYARLGHPERVDLVENPGPHGVPPENLAAIAQWMQRWLLHRDESIEAVELATLPPEELLCTAEGEVLRGPEERSVFDLNAEYALELAQRRRVRWERTPREAMVREIGEKIGVPPDAERRDADRIDDGLIERLGYRIEKFVLRARTAVPLPALVFHPSKPNGQTCLYLHDDGKAGAAAPGGPIEKLVAGGTRVVAVDLSGQGETGLNASGGRAGAWPSFALAYLLGRSLVGIRVEDTIDAAEFAATLGGDHGMVRPVRLIGHGHSGIVALHAAALYPDWFASVSLRDTPRDWTSTVGRADPEGEIDDHVVHGALELYDLPDLVRLAGESRVRYE